MRIAWSKGPDLRDENGIYRYGDREYMSVTTALSGAGDMVWVHAHAVKTLIDELVELERKGLSHHAWEVATEDGPDGPKEKWVKVERSPSEALADGQYISRAGFRFMKQCADRGELLHGMMEDYARGVVVDHQDDVEVADYALEKLYSSKKTVDVGEYVLMARQLLAFLHTAKPVIIASEVPLFNDKYKYAGRLDAIAALDGKTYVLDLKSSTDYRRSWGAQVGAYKNADFYLATVEGAYVEVEMPPIDAAGIIMVDTRRCFMRAVDNADYAFEQLFLPSLQAATANRSMQLPKVGRLFEVKV